MDAPENIILDRQVIFCPSTVNWPAQDLLKTCPQCGAFLLYCCVCNEARADLPNHLQPTEPCHHYRVMFISGACVGNGRPEAKAGVGVAFGNKPESQISRPITDVEDKSPLRSSQRAELYAVKVGLEQLDFLAGIAEEHGGKLKGDYKTWIIATDSKYVVRGMIQWQPKWKESGWGTSPGIRPANLDLFLSLDALISGYEALDVQIGFWYVPREHNQIAVRLAKEAAVDGDVATVTSKKRQVNPLRQVLTAKATK